MKTKLQTMKAPLIFSLCLLLLLLVVFAKADTSLPTYDATTLKILQQLQTTPIQKGLFLQKKKLPFLNNPLISNGQFLQKENHDLLWKVESPVTSSMVITDQGIIIDGEAMPGNPFSHLIKDIFNAILQGNVELLNNNFTLQGLSTENRWTLQLTPKVALLQKAISTIEVSGTDYIETLRFIETAGAETTITFSQLELQ